MVLLIPALIKLNGMSTGSSKGGQLQEVSQKSRSDDQIGGYHDDGHRNGAYNKCNHSARHSLLVLIDQR